MTRRDRETRILGVQNSFYDKRKIGAQAVSEHSGERISNSALVKLSCDGGGVKRPSESFIFDNPATSDGPQPNQIGMVDGIWDREWDNWVRSVYECIETALDGSCTVHSEHDGAVLWVSRELAGSGS